MNDLMKSDATITMDSREIAELTGKEHRNVCRDIEAQLGRLDGGMLRFEHTYRNEQNGQEYPCYKLPYRETMILVSGYSVELRARVIDRWMELERASAPKLPTGPELMALALIEAQKVIEQKDRLIEAQKPAVRFMNDVTGSRSAVEMGQAAKIIDMGFGRNQLFDFLRDHNILRENNEPYQKYIDAGWFRVVEQPWKDANGDTHIGIKTLVHQKGIDGIIKLIRSCKTAGELAQ